MPTPLHQKQNVGNYFFCYEKSLYHPQRSNRILPSNTWGCNHTFSRENVAFRLVFSVSTFICVGATECVRACLGCVRARRLLIGLIRRSCCTAPLRLILLLPSFFLSALLWCSQSDMIFTPSVPPPALAPLTSAVPSLRSFLAAEPWVVAAVSPWPCSSSLR